MQLSEITGRASQRLNEGQTGPVYYPQDELTAAANEGLRVFAMLTLCLEVTAPWNVPAASTFNHMLAYFPDWLCCLRVSDITGKKIRPTRLDDLTALDSAWLNQPGDPKRYAAVGADLLIAYPQPPVIGTTLQIKYAQCPAPLVNLTDTPAIRTHLHPALVDYTVYRCRQIEGGGEFEKVLPNLDSFLQAAQAEADYVRARAIAGRYDKMPFELERFDRSKLLKLRADLPPARKAA